MKTAFCIGFSDFTYLLSGWLVSSRSGPRLNKTIDAGFHQTSQPQAMRNLASVPLEKVFPKKPGNHEFLHGTGVVIPSHYFLHARDECEISCNLQGGIFHMNLHWEFKRYPFDSVSSHHSNIFHPSMVLCLFFGPVKYVPCVPEPGFSCLVVFAAQRLVFPAACGICNWKDTAIPSKGDDPFAEDLFKWVG